MATTTFEKPVGTEIETLKSGKQDKTDNALETTDKTIVGALNELNGNLTDIVKTDGTENTTKIVSMRFSWDNTHKWHIVATDKNGTERIFVAATT